MIQIKLFNSCDKLRKEQLFYYICKIEHLFIWSGLRKGVPNKILFVVSTKLNKKEM